MLSKYLELTIEIVKYYLPFIKYLLQATHYTRTKVTGSRPVRVILVIKGTGDKIRDTDINDNKQNVLALQEPFSTRLDAEGSLCAGEELALL